MSAGDDIAALAERLARSPGVTGKTDIAHAVEALGIGGASAIAVGDDTAAIPCGDGWSLFACEGMIASFVEAMPWFAGWSGVMVNLSDVAAMGGKPLAVVNALWAPGVAEAAEVLAGMRAASAAYGVPIVGGHTNLHAAGRQLSVAVLGHARALLTSFDASPGDVLVAAIDLRGKYHDPYPFFDAASTAPPERLRADLDLLPMLAESGLSVCAKDISQGGIIGTAAMLAECSGVGIDIDLEALPMPAGANIERWLTTFPSFGYLLAAKPSAAAEICSAFTARDIAAAVIGDIDGSGAVSIRSSSGRAVVRDIHAEPLIGCAPSAPTKEAEHA
ncbi:sll0787 family AIR synthase-like protein [Mesorhizobium sp. NZP2077]|uniref:sll0787 family AIR synthase-like protein n=1 Tax=Mesorhizobium sp. NZP2077 TaxID=2483404 RepID=UPI0015520EC2|nr:sll0787 family AIR synthase-like protein [Mesorhizobium sp. NZP2077]QKC84465.1 sll0787 family AIR synthase-like protein [Mesorhizobium sp. NZP2077]QKD18028.1 sll0787 family AIR synthase-like protein [Mesorhizobium sp. NZP2077]